MRHYALLALLALAACSPDTTSPPTPHVSLAVDARTLPAPTLLSAERIQHVDAAFDLVRVTFNDIAGDEAGVNVVFTGGDTPSQTQFAASTTWAVTGVRSVSVYAEVGKTTAQINYEWQDASYGTTCGCVFGPLSNAVTITDAVIVTAKRRGRK